MTAADLRALNELARWHTLVRPGAFGEVLFGGGVKRSGNCSCPHARAGGKVLARLRRLGLAVRIDDGRTHGWQITIRGKIAVLDRARGVAVEKLLCEHCRNPVGMHRDGDPCPPKVVQERS